MTTPLHSININVEGDRICKSAPTQVALETQDDNDDVELQKNANCFWGAKRCKYHGFVSRRHIIATSNSRQPLIHGTNRLDSFTTFAHGNIVVKRKHNNVSSLIIDFTNKNNKNSYEGNGND